MTPRRSTDTQPVEATDTNTGTGGEDSSPAAATSRQIGRNSNGDPTLYPSDVEAVSRQYGLTGPEAERLITEGDVSEAAADRIKRARAVYRVAYERITSAHGVDEDALRRDDVTPTAGPYGPNATYDEVSVPADRDHAAVATEVTTRVTSRVANVGEAE